MLPEPEPFSLPSSIPQWPEGSYLSKILILCGFYDLGHEFILNSEMGFGLYG